MSDTQKVIKYLAIFFAIFLIVSIFSSITFGIASFLNITNRKDELLSSGEEYNKTYEKGEISIINMDLKMASTTIKQGDTLKVESNSKNVTFKKRGNKLYISEKNYSFLKRKNSERKVTIYLPKDYIYDEVLIESGLGKLDIKQLNTNELILNLGAGEIKIDELNVSKEAEIDGGAGQITIKNGTINNLDLDMGVGKLVLEAKLTGESKIDAGVGESLINLLGSMNDYRIKVDKGVGSTRINNNTIQDNTYYGSGNNKVMIDGGVGKIDITVNDIENIVNSNYTFEFQIDKYLKDDEGDIIIVGKIISGTTSKDSTINILNSSNEVIASGKIKNKDVGLYQNEINTCNINESCAFIIENVSEEQLVDATKIVKAD